MSPNGQVHRTNALLGRLSRRDLQELLPRCEEIALSIGEVVGRPGRAVTEVFFPLASYISMVAPIDGRPQLEVGLVGSEGMVGIAAALGVNYSPSLSLVQGAGSALRIDAHVFARIVARNSGMQNTFNRYSFVMIAQLAQTAACTRFHLLPARLARWLLMTRDRARMDRFVMTHEFLAYILGVRRVGVTQAAGALRARNLIRYSRGQIELLDVNGLKAASCSCYSADKRAYARAFN
jgi:CRP-like cAMP-binding protein